MRKTAKWLALGVAALLAAGLLGGCGVLIYASHSRQLLERFVSTRADRKVSIGGSFEAHLFSREPWVVARNVTIDNPPWTPSGEMAHVASVTLTFEWPFLTHALLIDRLELQGAELHLQRDKDGRANWQWRAPGSPDSGAGPLIHSLSAPQAHVDLDDARQHLQFAGSVGAEESGDRGTSPLRISGAGQLNGRPVALRIEGEPLAGSQRGRAYHFTFSEDSSGSHLEGKGFLPQPFDFDLLETDFRGSGADLNDLYYLTGLGLPNTGPYHLSGHLARNVSVFRFTDLSIESGRSDLAGTLTIETSARPSRFDADLHSNLLRLSDLGASAAGRAAPSGKETFLSSTALPTEVLRRASGNAHFHARELAIGRQVLHGFAVELALDHGVLTAAPLSAIFAEGRIEGRIQVDAQEDVPADTVDLRFQQVQLSQLMRKSESQAPLDGMLQGRVSLRGHGRSVHEFAASADGTLTAVLPHGAVRASLAELTSVDLTRSLGLMLAHKKDDTPVRCGIASFKAHGGKLTSQDVVMDTEPVLITGAGTIDLDSEALELQLRGEPKHFRLVHVRAPVSIRGSLLHPSVTLDKSKSLAQAGGAVALGAVLTPIAAILPFVDPGLAKNADCAALRSQ